MANVGTALRYATAAAGIPDLTVLRGDYRRMGCSFLPNASMSGVDGALVRRVRETKMTTSATMPRLAALVAAGILFAAQSPASAQSFDCRDSEHRAERTVCGSDRLSALDVQLSALYARVLATTPGARGRAQVRAYQREFLAARNACGKTAGCIADAYQDQISVLSARVRLARNSRT